MSNSGSGPVPPTSASKALLVYNALRLLLLAACLGLGYLAGLRSLALVLAALVVSGVLSWFVLRSQRIRAGMAVERAVGRSAVVRGTAGGWRRRREAMQARVAAEDAYADELRRRQAESQKQSSP